MARQVFISYSGSDRFEASLLQYALEHILATDEISSWSFHRDQERSQKNIARSIKDVVQESAALIFLVSPDTLEAGATQWMELAYADAFGVKTFVLLHRVGFADLKQKPGVPPLLLSSQCNSAVEWQRVIEDLREFLTEGK
jgi:hypothetical protein